MTDPTNDIDALLGYLSICADRYSCHTLPSDVAGNYHAALTALVAARDGLKQRVAELEAQNPSDGEVLQAVMMNREAELRVTCSALAGIYSNPNGVGDPVRNGQIAAAAAKAALDALSQPRAWSTCDPVRDLCGDRDSDLDGEALAAMRKGVARE